MVLDQSHILPHPLSQLIKEERTELTVNGSSKQFPVAEIKKKERERSRAGGGRGRHGKAHKMIK
jgi:hypothetical protein